MGWFPKPDESVDARGRRFFRTARRVCVIFAIGGAIGAAQTYFALRSGEQWKNSTGQFMTPTEMIQQTWAFGIASVLGVVLCVLLHRAGKKRGYLP
jgi:hypothetical protein